MRKGAGFGCTGFNDWMEKQVSEILRDVASENKTQRRITMRFNYVKYDEESTAKQEGLKQIFETLENHIEAVLPNNTRAKALVMTHLEEAYMWTGKAIRDEQLGRGERLSQQCGITSRGKV